MKYLLIKQVDKTPASTSVGDLAFLVAALLKNGWVKQAQDLVDTESIPEFASKPTEFLKLAHEEGDPVEFYVCEVRGFGE